MVFRIESQNAKDFKTFYLWFSEIQNAKDLEKFRVCIRKFNRGTMGFYLWFSEIQNANDLEKFRVCIRKSGKPLELRLGFEQKINPSCCVFLGD